MILAYSLEASNVIPLVTKARKMREFCPYYYYYYYYYSIPLEVKIPGVKNKDKKM